MTQGRHEQRRLSVTTARPAGGFSLVEVIVAVGVLAGLLLSIATMFVLAARQVKAGRTITEAVTLAQDIMERFDRSSFTALYTTLGASAGDTTRTVSSVTAGSPLSGWQAEIARRLAGGAATVTLDALGSGSPGFGNATGLRLTVEVSWEEIGRPRSVRLSTGRF
jgi:type IV pilus assembly protein PilV